MTFYYTQEEIYWAVKTAQCQEPRTSDFDQILLRVKINDTNRIFWGLQDRAVYSALNGISIPRGALITSSYRMKLENMILRGESIPDSVSQEVINDLKSFMKENELL